MTSEDSDVDISDYNDAYDDDAEDEGNILAYDWDADVDFSYEDDVLQDSMDVVSVADHTPKYPLYTFTIMTVKRRQWFRLCTLVYIRKDADI